MFGERDVRKAVAEDRIHESSTVLFRPRDASAKQPKKAEPACQNII
jgi:hypothetical protein